MHLVSITTLLTCFHGSDCASNRDANETFQIRVAHSIAAASSKQPEAALSIGNLDALAEAVELSMEQLKAVETDAADVRAEAETLAEVRQLNSDA